jgi:hypothetical protein
LAATLGYEHLPPLATETQAKAMLRPAQSKKHGTKPLALPHINRQRKASRTPLCTVNLRAVASLARHLKKVHYSITERYKKFEFDPKDKICFVGKNNLSEETDGQHCL